MRLAKQERRHVEIGVMPLIDVVFLLLIFVMLTATYQPGEPFDVEAAASAGEERVEEGESVVLLDAAGRVSIDGNEVPLGGLAERFAAGAPAVVLLKADADAPAELLMALVARLRAAGVERVDLLTVAPR